MVISGHSHQPLTKKHNGVLYLNLGSAGPKRFHLPVSVTILTLDKNTVEADLLELKV